ncbi:ran-specific GTPase-activating protein [Platysternon megacephalum]|uniref:Ran-specific GTPase-activating protein n=1 Tax=Platysternon megacephalum TaxID=55544 RepID=A0A4D9FA28_9SAUR|nr:ran-specific GTPase-activating protein [Platysternon megacephalum]
MRKWRQNEKIKYHAQNVRLTQVLEKWAQAKIDILLIIAHILIFNILVVMKLRNLLLCPKVKVINYGCDPRALRKSVGVCVSGMLHPGILNGQDQGLGESKAKGELE